MRFTPVFATIALLGTGSIGAAVGHEISPASNMPDNFSKRLNKDLVYRRSDKTDPEDLDKRLNRENIYRKSDDTDPETLNKRIFGDHDIYSI
ncbi:hypothetical protein AnigIFM60653_003393 [Aspergillus niger]|nr:hypothetical protein AnigIFM60653_003393 [Aspergillus niger]GLA18019.1 hypothetical protein AnigIFM62618_005174 [Aspergillus niger]